MVAAPFTFTFAFDHYSSDIELLRKKSRNVRAYAPSVVFQFAIAALPRILITGFHDFAAPLQNNKQVNK